MRALLATLFLTACSAAQPEELLLSAPEPARLQVAIAPEAAEPAEAALELWREASGGAFAPEVSIGVSLTADLQVVAVDARPACDGGANWGCSWGSYIQLWAGIPADQAVSTAAHEVGHFLGLEHQPGSGGLMDPKRSSERRRWPCVSADDAAAAGFQGPGACAF